jgi:superfamily II DNA/RNA helicase
MNNFEGFSLSQNLKNSLARMNFTEPTPIQVSSIPLALEGRDILVQHKPELEKQQHLAFH